MEATVELLCHGLLREYLARKACTKTLAAFDNEKPRNESSITNRKLLAQSLHIGKLITKNKEKGEIYTTFLEMIVDHLVARYMQPEETHSSPPESKTIPKPNPSPPPEPAPIHHEPPPQPARIHEAPPQPARKSISRNGSASNLRASAELSVSDLDEHEPTISILKSQFRSSSPDLANGGLRGTERKVVFSLDSPKIMQKSFHSSGGLTGSGGLSGSGGIGGGEDIVSKHAKLYSGNGTKNGVPKDPESTTAAAPPLPDLSEPLDSVASIPDLDKLVFGTNRGPKMFQEEWHQGFFFSDCTDLRYGLVQIKGGPCGVIAAVQGYILKELISSPIFQKHGFNPTDNVRTTALVHALTEILWQVGGSKSAKLVLNPALPKRFKAYKLADWTVTTLNSKNDLQTAIRANLSSYTERSGCGVLLFMYSAILTRGIANVRADMDVADTSLLAPHKYCAQELVNLLLIGKATSNVFDGNVDMEGTALKGLTNRATIGFLTLMEKMGYCQVGNHFKSPVYPIWIIYSESHYSLLFGTATPGAPKFDVFYYDELGNQDEQYQITVDITSSVPTKVIEEDMISPIEMCIFTKWPNAICDWNGSEPLL